MRSISSIRSIRSAALTVALLALTLFVGSGCAQMLPRTTGLERVHAIYRQEFSDVVVPQPAGPTATKGTPAGRFGRTLAEIREYRAAHPRTPPTAEHAHLTVLESMIYVQTGRPALARLLADDVATARGQLVSGTGDAARDLLFATAMPHLIDGWEQIARDAASPELTDRRVLEAAAQALCELLAAQPQTGSGDDGGDDGGAYLATTAAIFNLHNYAVGRRQRDPDGAPGTPNPFAGLPVDSFAAFGRDLLGAQLDEDERELATSTVRLASMAGEVDGRLRYLEWYRWLSGAAGATPATGCATHE